MHIFRYSCIYVNVYMHIYMHIYMYIYMYICQMNLWQSMSPHWNSPLRSGMLLASPDVLHRPRSNSLLHFDIKNVQYVHAGKWNASARCLISAALFERCPQVAGLLRQDHFGNHTTDPLVRFRKNEFWSALYTGFQRMYQQNREFRKARRREEHGMCVWSPKVFFNQKNNLIYRGHESHNGSFPTIILSARLENLTILLSSEGERNVGCVYDHQRWFSIKNQSYI